MAILELKNTTTYKTRLGDLDGKGASADVVVGGSDPSKFIPNINISRCDNEVFLNLNFGKSIVTNEKHLFSDGKVSINVGGIDHTQYIKDKKNSEWELSFAERPDCESFEFDMVHSDSLSFYFMPPLEDQYARDTEGMTWEEYQKLYTVDPKAVGGYTVYHNKRNNKYKAGKFLTIWPPWFIDAHGDRKKGIVKVNEEKKQLIITCDKLWLDNAAYPVVLDPTIGYTSVGTYGNIAATYSYTWAGNTYNATEDGIMYFSK